MHNINTINTKQKEYTKYTKQVIDMACSALRREPDNDVCSNISSLVASNTGHFNDLDITQQTFSLPCQPFEPTSKKESQYDIGEDIGVSINSQETDIWLPYCIPGNQYFSLLQNLNKEQRAIFYHVLHWYKTKREPMHLFVTGGAEVGKSLLLKAIYQRLQRWFTKNLQEDPNN